MRIVANLDVYLIGRLRCPPNTVTTPAPRYPCGGPFPSRNPDPTFVGVQHPTTIVEGRPAPVGFALVARPVPTPIVSVDPAATGVRRPILIDARWGPDVTPSVIVRPTTMRFERSAEIGGDGHIRFRVCWRKRGECEKEEGGDSWEKAQIAPLVIVGNRHRPAYVSVSVGLIMQRQAVAKVPIKTVVSANSIFNVAPTRSH